VAYDVDLDCGVAGEMTVLFEWENLRLGAATCDVHAFPFPPKTRLSVSAFFWVEHDANFRTETRALHEFGLWALCYDDEVEVFSAVT